MSMCSDGGGATRFLPRDRGAKELNGDPTVGPHPRINQRPKIESVEPKIDLRIGSDAEQSR